MEYSYNAEGAIGELRHCSIQNGQSTLTTYRFEYDSLGRLVRSSESVGGTVQRTEHIYDGYNRLSRQSWTLGGKTYSESYVYDDPSDTNQNGDGASDTNKNGDGALTQMTTATGAVIVYQYDTLRRLTRSKVALNGSTVYTTAYAFRDLDASRTTTQVQYRNVRSANGGVLECKKYTYDALGNITRISQSTGHFYPLVAYEYDAQNQLTKETYYDGKGTATKNIKLAYYYDYDTAGNILRVEKGTVNSSGVLTKTVEQTYSYNDSDWNDLLTSVNVNGTTYNFTYDQSGNPERYFTKNGLEYVLDWKNGSQLAYSSCFDEQWQAAYYYDANGIRRQKRLEGDVTNYTTQNGKVIREETSSRYSATCILDFVYDESGRPFALYYSSNGGNSFATYYYILNLQGDVVKLVTESGAVAASYEYDAWGNILSSTGSMARTNPLRYRGYYYDVETGFYYLQSRYYDPANRRFINADAYASTGQGFVGTNMFAYCNNSPIVLADHTGHLPNVNLMITDSGWQKSKPDPKTEALYNEMQSYGFVPPGENVRIIQITKGKHNRTINELRKESFQKTAAVAMITLGTGYVSTAVGIFLDVMKIASPDNSISVPTGEYISYDIYFEYDVGSGPCLSHCWEIRRYVLVAYPDGSGFFLYLYDTEGGSYS